MTTSDTEVVIGPTRPPEPGMKVGPGPEGAPGRPPTGCVSLSKEDMLPQLHGIAASLLKGNWGALTPFRIGQKYFMARVEPHFRKPTNDPRLSADRKKRSIPEGWHKGVSVFKVKTDGQDKSPTPNVATEYTPSKPTSGRTQLLDRLNKLMTEIKIV